MSWDCPHWNNEICELNGSPCVPGKGQCVLKGRYEIKSGNREKKKNKKNKKSNPSQHCIDARNKNQE